MYMYVCAYIYVYFLIIFLDWVILTEARQWVDTFIYIYIYIYIYMLARCYKDIDVDYTENYNQKARGPEHERG